MDDQSKNFEKGKNQKKPLFRKGPFLWLAVPAILVLGIYIGYRFLSARPHVDRETWDQLSLGMTEKEIEELLGFSGASSSLVVQGGSIVSMPAAEINPQERVWLGDDRGAFVAFDPNGEAWRIIVFLAPEESFVEWLGKFINPQKKLLQIARWLEKRP